MQPAILRACLRAIPQLQAGEMLAAINVAILAEPPTNRSAQSQRQRAITALERTATGDKGKRSGVDPAKMSPAARAAFLGQFGISAE